MKNVRRDLQSGFTLIELLVVVAIIGILASVILGSLSSARDKSKDASAIASMSSLRSSAEIFYSNGNTYTGMCLSTDVAKLLAAAADQTGGATDCNESPGAYAAKVALLESGQFFCIDSTGVAKKGSVDLGADATVCP